VLTSLQQDLWHLSTERNHCRGIPPLEDYGPAVVALNGETRASAKGSRASAVAAL
jgi:hypothetical protein